MSPSDNNMTPTQVFLSNLKLLGFDQGIHCKGKYNGLVIGQNIFTLAANNQKAFEVISYFLFKCLDKAKTRIAFKDVWPPNTKSSTRKYMNTAYNWINEIKREPTSGNSSNLVKYVHVNKSHLENCRGEHMNKLMFAFSTYVLQKVLKSKQVNEFKELKDVNKKMMEEELQELAEEYLMKEKLRERYSNDGKRIMASLSTRDNSVSKSLVAPRSVGSRSIAAVNSLLSRVLDKIGKRKRTEYLEESEDDIDVRVKKATPSPNHRHTVAIHEQPPQQQQSPSRSSAMRYSPVKPELQQELVASTSSSTNYSKSDTNPSHTSAIMPINIKSPLQSPRFSPANRTQLKSDNSKPHHNTTNTQQVQSYHDTYNTKQVTTGSTNTTPSPHVKSSYLATIASKANAESHSFTRSKSSDISPVYQHTRALSHPTEQTTKPQSPHYSKSPVTHSISLPRKRLSFPSEEENLEEPFQLTKQIVDIFSKEPTKDTNNLHVILPSFLDLPMSPSSSDDDEPLPDSSSLSKTINQQHTVKEVPIIINHTTNNTFTEKSFWDFQSTNQSFSIMDHTSSNTNIADDTETQVFKAPSSRGSVSTTTSNAHSINKMTAKAAVSRSKTPSIYSIEPSNKTSLLYSPSLYSRTSDNSGVATIQLSPIRKNHQQASTAVSPAESDMFCTPFRNTYTNNGASESPMFDEPTIQLSPATKRPYQEDVPFQNTNINHTLDSPMFDEPTDQLLPATKRRFQEDDIGETGSDYSSPKRSAYTSRSNIRLSPKRSSSNKASSVLFLSPLRQSITSPIQNLVSTPPRRSPAATLTTDMNTHTTTPPQPPALLRTKSSYQERLSRSPSISRTPPSVHSTNQSRYIELSPERVYNRRDQHYKKYNGTPDSAGAIDNMEEVDSIRLEEPPWTPFLNSQSSPGMSAAEQNSRATEFLFDLTSYTPLRRNTRILDKLVEIRRREEQ